MNRLFYTILSGKIGAYIQIKILMRKAAKAFGVNSPGFMGLSVSELLKAYARFTAEASKQAVNSEQDINILRRKLYNTAYNLGSSLHSLLKPRNERERLDIITLLYKNIGITVNEASPEKFCFYSCYFSTFYTPDVCFIMSAADQGIFAGIYKKENSMLEFKERITEGCNKCTAYFTERTNNYEKSNCNRGRGRRGYDGKRASRPFSGNNTGSRKGI